MANDLETYRQSLKAGVLPSKMAPMAKEKAAPGKNAPWMFHTGAKNKKVSSAKGELFGKSRTIRVNPNGSGYVDIHIKVGSPNGTDAQGNPINQMKKPKSWIQQINEF